MITTFFKPTRIVSGLGSLGTIGRLAKEPAISRMS